MKLYLLRHADAEDGASSDHDRRLTSNGIQQAKTAAKVLAALDVEPAHVYSSPRVRAKHTAEIVAETLGLKVELREEVNFGFSVPALQILLDIAGNVDLMLVGHEPTMSTVIRELTGADVQMKKCGLARIDILSLSPLKGELVWLIPPKVFNSIHAEK